MQKPTSREPNYEQIYTLNVRLDKCFDIIYRGCTQSREMDLLDEIEEIQQRIKYLAM